MPIAGGTSLGPYEVVSLLGAGGMGEVYRARDTRLGREVAVKVLPAAVASQPERLRRFEQEARAEGILNHPNVVIVHDVGAHDGIPYLVTELLEGRSLRQRLEQGPLPLREAVGAALQIARGLAAAHGKGIVHRDLKPDNVFLTPGGGVKILDFGVAKLLEPVWPSTPMTPEELAGLADAETQASGPATGWGVLVGTPAYMSPEQARGGHVDFRSDLFSFGIVFYEMLTGADPFRRGNAADTLGAILREMPPPVQSNGRRRTPADVHRILQRTLAKDPAGRYAATPELVADLERLARWLDRRLVTPLRLALAAAGGVAVLALTWLAGRPAPVPPRERPTVSLLVADLENRTGDPVFDGALEQALQIGLEGAPFVTAFDRAQARRQAASLSADKETRLDEARARLVSASLGIKLNVVGSIERAGERYVLETRVVDPLTSQRLARASAAATSKAGVLQAVDAVAVRLRTDLGDVAPRSSTALDRETFTAASLDAMSSYARAQELHYQGRSEEAIEEYRRAVERDPGFGRAYCGLAALLYNQGEREKSEEQFQKALAHLDRMSDRERYRTRGLYYILVRNDAKAIEEYERLVREYPADSAGRANLAFAHFLAHHMDEALAEGRAAVEIYPKLITARSNLALYAMYAGDFEGADREAHAVLAQNASYVKGYVARGRIDEARLTYDRLQAISPRGASLAAMGLADLALYEGRLTEAAALLETSAAADAERRFGAAEAVKRVTLAQVRLAQGRTLPAVAAARGALGLSRQPNVAYPAALVLLGAGHSADAARIASGLGAKLEADARAYGMLVEGEVALAGGDARRALERFQAAKALADTWIGRLALARAYLAAGALAEAHSELERCVKRRGESLAVFLDDVPTAWYFPPVHYYAGRVAEGLGVAGAADSYRSFLSIRPNADAAEPLAADARRRLAAR
jgi:tetratricopeptide (TPR) repeat protein